MIHKMILTLTLVALALLSLGCRTVTPTQAPEIDTQATIDAAVAATATAQAEMDAQINAAVETAVDEAVDEAVDVAVEDALQDLEEEYLMMSEEEFNQAIEEAVTEAMASSEQTVVYVEEASSDGTLTQDEIDEIEYYAYYADDLLYLADEMIYLYYDMYAELAYETLYLLEDVEEDLSQMADAMTEITELATDAADMLAQGMEVHQETIDEIAAIAQGTHEQISNMNAEWEAWATAIQTERDVRLQSVQEMSTSFVPENRAVALNETLNFVDAVRNGLSDYSISQTELLEIAQFGANAVAGLQAHGGPQLQGLAENISTITQNLALGQTPSAINNLGALEGSLGKVPGFEMPDRPGFSPSVPNRGGRP
jgi:hypothetical protein